MKRREKSLSIIAGAALMIVFGATYLAGTLGRDGGLVFDGRSAVSGEAHEEGATSAPKTASSTLPSAPFSSSTAVSVNTPASTQQMVPESVAHAAPRDTTHTVSLPGPMVIERSVVIPVPEAASSAPSVLVDTGGALSPKTIAELSNNERVKQGLPALVYSTRLTAIAEAKALDMITKQYFAHVAPDGADVVVLAGRYGYPYLNIGENLALGDFASSSAVVDGWMNSPGHRANILNKYYTEIGVAALAGSYEGRAVWFAVQEFGRPESACPSPDKPLEAKIATYRDQITALGGTLDRLRAEIAAPGIDQETYAAKAKDYNTIADLYNDLLATTKADIETYNNEVRTYNACIGPATGNVE